MVMPIIILSAGLIVIVLFLIERIKQYSVKATLIKTLASMLFIVLGAYSWYVTKHVFGFLALLGLTCGMLGDIFLEQKCVFKEHDEIFTYTGFACFFIGHIFYIVGIIMEFLNDANILYLIIPIFTGLLCGALVLLMEKPLKLQYGKMKWIVFIYGVMLFTMASYTVSSAIYHSFSLVSVNMLFASGLLFAISDLILSGMYFGNDDGKPLNSILNISIYYLAQYLIAFSIFFL